jgi:hypothetical protein
MFWSYAPWFAKKYLFTLDVSGGRASVSFKHILSFFYDNSKGHTSEYMEVDSCQIDKLFLHIRGAGVAVIVW